jgi:hypothetical protein
VDTSKLITVVIWATLALVAYEAIKGLFTSTAASTSTTSGTTSPAQALSDLESYFAGTSTDAPPGSLSSIPANDVFSQAELDSGSFGGSASDNALDVGQGVASNSQGDILSD